MNVFIKVTSQVSVLESVLNSLKADLKKQYYIHHVSISFTFVWVFQFQGQVCHPNTILVTQCWWHNVGQTFWWHKWQKRWQIQTFFQFRRIWNFDQKLVKMTEIGKTRIQSLIKVGYVLSLLKFSDLNSKIEFQPYLS